VHAFAPLDWRLSSPTAAVARTRALAHRCGALVPRHPESESISGTLPTHVCYFGDHLLHDVVGPTSAGWHSVAVVPELLALAAAASGGGGGGGGGKGARAGGGGSSGSASGGVWGSGGSGGSAASSAFLLAPESPAGLDAAYELRALGHGPLCARPSASAAQLLRSAVLVVPSVEWLADTLLPAVQDAVATAEAAGLKAFPLANLVGSDEPPPVVPGPALQPPPSARGGGAGAAVSSAASLAASSSGRDGAAPLPHSSSAKSVQHGLPHSGGRNKGGEGASAAAAAASAPSFTARLATAFGGLRTGGGGGGAGGKGRSADEVRHALTKAERSVSVHAQDLAAAFGLLPVLQVRWMQRSRCMQNG
jgi:trimeric autotransporter adhesin